MKKISATSFFGLVVAALAGFTIYDYRSSQKSDERKSQDAKLIQAKPEELSVIEIKTHDQVTGRLEKKRG